jgi:hypothetical protein
MPSRDNIINMIDLTSLVLTLIIAKLMQNDPYCNQFKDDSLYHIT